MSITYTKRTAQGNYIVLRDGRKIGFVKREQRRTAKIGTVDFIAYTGTQPAALSLDRFASVCDTLKGAVAVIDRLTK